MVTVRTLARLATALVTTTYVLLVFGASVRVHGAGLACPDWPLCFGEVIPTLNFEVGLEWGHRVLAGLISLGFLGLIVGMWTARERVGREWHPAPRALLLDQVRGRFVMALEAGCVQRARMPLTHRGPGTLPSSRL